MKIHGPRCSVPESPPNYFIVFNVYGCLSVTHLMGKALHSVLAVAQLPCMNVDGQPLYCVHTLYDVVKLPRHFIMVPLLNLIWILFIILCTF